MPAIPLNSGFTGQVGQESNLQPAVLETQSAVSGGVGRVATCRAAPLSLSSDAAECRRGSRSLGHLLGQPLLSQEPFSLL